MRDQQADVCSCGCQADPPIPTHIVGFPQALGLTFGVPETMPSDMADALMRAEFAVSSAQMRAKLPGGGGVRV